MTVMNATETLRWRVWCQHIILHTYRRHNHFRQDRKTIPISIIIPMKYVQYGIGHHLLHRILLYLKLFRGRFLLSWERRKRQKVFVASTNASKRGVATNIEASELLTCGMFVVVSEIIVIHFLDTPTPTVLRSHPCPPLSLWGSSHARGPTQDGQDSTRLSAWICCFYWWIGSMMPSMSVFLQGTTRDD